MGLAIALACEPGRPQSNSRLQRRISSANSAADGNRRWVAAGEVPDLGDGTGRRFVRGSGDIDIADDPSNVIVASSPTILIGDCLCQAYVTAEKHEGAPCAAVAGLSAYSQHRCRKYGSAPTRRNRRNDSTSFGRNVSHPVLPTFRRDRKIAT